MNTFLISWTDLKTVSGFPASLSYLDQSNAYTVFIFDTGRDLVSMASVVKDGGVDVLDFEKTYKSKAALYPDLSTAFNTGISNAQDVLGQTVDIGAEDVEASINAHLRGVIVQLILGGSGIGGSIKNLDVNLSDILTALSANTVPLNVPNRPSSGPGRTHIQKGQVNITASGKVASYTVTSGKTLYVTGLVISGFNNSAITQGQWTISDGSGGAVVVAGNLPAVVASVVNVPLNYPEPLQFTDSVYFNSVAGTPTLGISFCGYEEA